MPDIKRDHPHAGEQRTGHGPNPRLHCNTMNDRVLMTIPECRDCRMPC